MATCPRLRPPRSLCRRAVLLCSSDGAASIPKFGPEIKNRCTKDGVNGEKLASIPKSELEIKNRCRKQHIPRHASCLGCFAWGRARAGSTVAAKAGADAPGGGISLRFCRRGCAAPAFKAATLNVLPRSTSCHAQRPSTLNVPPPLRQSKKRMTSADVILFDL